MRILHVTKRFWPFVGGVERYVYDLATAQGRQGHAIRVLTINRNVLERSPTRLPRRDSVDGVDVLRVSARGGPRKQVLAEWPGPVIEAVRWANVIHHHDPRFALETTLTLATVIRKPVIMHTHGLFFHTSRAYLVKRAAMRLYYGPLFRLLVRAVVADSRADLDLLVRTAGFPAANVRLILNGIDLRAYQSIASHPVPGRLLVYGRVDEHKGIDRLLRALARVASPWTLQICGTGSEILLSELQALATELGVAGRICWRGRIDDAELLEARATAAAILFPSRFEGFGLALVEAMASGAVVLASSIEAHREVLGAGMGDMLVDFDDLDSAARAVSEALALEPAARASLGALARTRAEAFSIDRMVGEIDVLYRELGLPSAPPDEGA